MSNKVMRSKRFKKFILELAEGLGGNRTGCGDCGLWMVKSLGVSGMAAMALCSPHVFGRV
jgi:hypothetical protein